MTSDRAPLIPRDALGDGVLARVYRYKYEDEERAVARCLSGIDLSATDTDAISLRAATLVEKTRASKRTQPLLDAFLLEYGLSNREGIALMCLAEALLRIPDDATRDALIADKISPGQWMSHVGRAESMLVNASTLGLLLTGRVIAPDPDFMRNPVHAISALIKRTGEPVIRAAMMRAMRILGHEFVLGQSVTEGIARANKEYGDDWLCSFDMLGEAARTMGDADRYFASYSGAIEAISDLGPDREIHARSGVSVKLSALHPRYEYTHHGKLLGELGERLGQLCALAARHNLTLTIDAEEAHRLELSLHLIEQVAAQRALSGWDGLGLAVQAYGKRALPVIDWTNDLARRTGRRAHVRLVKGAYWDAEIKAAQIMGMSDFPVYTRKAATDVSYLACARAALKHRDRLYCQFATHNAHTICAVMHLLGGDVTGVEFQRLHGMGELLYGEAQDMFADFPRLRIYAPVGGHRDVLAYLVRRLLENGANSSFVNRFMDKLAAPADIVRDPVAVINALDSVRQGRIALPCDMFGPRRRAASGHDLSSPATLAALCDAVAHEKRTRHDCRSLVPTHAGGDAPQMLCVVNPADNRDVLGSVARASTQSIDLAFAAARAAQPLWDTRGGQPRAVVLNNAADMLERDAKEFIALLVREGGKTYADAISELREAVDFCRYYATLAQDHFAGSTALPGPFGEDNSISLHGRGVFVCIAPWNFPLAIFLGQVAAALAAGNAVVCKPAEQTPLIAHRAVRLLRDAGVPDDAVHMAVGGADVGDALIRHRDTAGVAFTGSTQTARTINAALAERPGSIIPLIAETGGQNVMFADSTALLEQLSDDVVRSAFFSAGQRCSALRVLYVQDDIAEAAMSMLRGAMDTLEIGDPADISTDVGPVIDRDAAQRIEEHIGAMTRQALACHRLRVPVECASHGHFIAPHLFEIESIAQIPHEVFGPVLHVIRYPSSTLGAVIEEAQSTGFGLTMGVHSRMDGRWQDVHARARVGNMYVNRDMVGAVVESQPFGGQGLSGTGFKAGGPRYLFRFATEKTLSVNTMAAGGSTELLNLSDDQ